MFELLLTQSFTEGCISPSNIINMFQMFFKLYTTFYFSSVFLIPFEFFETWYRRKQSNISNLDFKWFTNHCIVFLYTFYTASQLLWKHSCMMWFWHNFSICVILYLFITMYNTEDTWNYAVNTCVKYPRICFYVLTFYYILGCPK